MPIERRSFLFDVKPKTVQSINWFEISHFVKLLVQIIGELCPISFTIIALSSWTFNY